MGHYAQIKSFENLMRLDTNIFELNDRLCLVNVELSSQHPSTRTTMDNTLGLPQSYMLRHLAPNKQSENIMEHSSMIE